MSQQILGIVRSINHTRGIEPEVVFQAIESGILQTLLEQFMGVSGLTVSIDRETGDVQAARSGMPIAPDDAFCRDDLIEPAIRAAGRILGEAERQSLLERYCGQVGKIVFAEGCPNNSRQLAIKPGRVDCELPPDERVSGERFMSGASVACQVIGAKVIGERVQVRLSRSRPGLLSGLLEHFISRVADGSLSVYAVAREPGYRSKVALISRAGGSCVGDCLEENGDQIAAICEQLGGEKIDMIDWQAGMEDNIAAALKPASIKGVYLFPIPGKAIAMLAPEEVQRAEGRGGKNLILASKLCGWDISLTTPEQWAIDHERARQAFREIGVESPNSILASGIFVLDELCVVEPDDLMRICSIDAETAAEIIAKAEERSGF